MPVIDIVVSMSLKVSPEVHQALDMGFQYAFTKLGKSLQEKLGAKKLLILQVDDEKP